MVKITYFLLILLVAIYLGVGLLMPSEQVFDQYGFSGNNLLEGKFWTLITSIFLHGGPAHLVLNCIALFFFGRAVEDEIPLPTYLTIFFLGGIAGNLCALFTYPADEIVIGASGAVFAIMGTGILLAPLDFVIYPALVPLPLALVGIFVAISEVIAFLTSTNSHVAHVAHIGGLVVGLAFGLSEGESKKGLVILGIIFLILLMLPNFWPLITKISYLEFLQSIFGGA